MSNDRSKSSSLADIPVVILKADADGRVPNDALAKLAEFVVTGEVSPGMRVETYAEFSARGRLPDCDCGHVQCVCAVARQHTATCAFRRALTCAVAIECEHGTDVCPECDACDCGGAK